MYLNKYYIRNSLCSPSYLVGSCASFDVIKKYIENQNSPQKD